MEIEEIENLAEIIADDTADRKDRVRKIVDAIQKLLTSDRLSLVEVLEGMKVENKGQIFPTHHTEVGAYNQALTDIISRINS